MIQTTKIFIGFTQPVQNVNDQTSDFVFVCLRLLLLHGPSIIPRSGQFFVELKNGLQVYHEVVSKNDLFGIRYYRSC